MIINLEGPTPFKPPLILESLVAFPGVHQAHPSVLP